MFILHIISHSMQFLTILHWNMNVKIIEYGCA